jgi:putative transcriptional regulator
VAEVTGLNKNTISKWVRNEVDNFSGEILAAFCDYFECDIGDLLYYEKE